MIKRSIGTKVAIILALLLIALSLALFPQQTPMLAYNNTKIYDKDFVTVLREIRDDVPKGASITTSANGPQTAYFSGHEIEIPYGVDSLKHLVEFMWRHDSNYLLAFQGKSSEENLQPLFSRYGIARSLTRSFEEIATYASETQTIHLFQLRSNITRGNIIMETDVARPLVSIANPLNGSTINAKSNHEILWINVTGTAFDADSKIKMIEVFIEDFPYKPVSPKSENDWSTWSFSDFVTSEGKKLIVARATDNAGNMQWFPINITASFHG
jgi:hypothetical protein